MQAGGGDEMMAKANDDDHKEEDAADKNLENGGDNQNIEKKFK
jgi:hypothetical protein